MTGVNSLFRPRWNKGERGGAVVVVRAMRHVDRVEGAVLGVELVKMLGRLRDVLRSGLARRMEEYGLGRVHDVASQSIEWGYGAAEIWASDLGIVKYITILDTNGS